MAKKIRVLIVDDAALVRQLLTQVLNEDPDIEVVGAAIDPLMARDMIKRLNPDVLTLDVEMPRMDGVTFLANLMRLRPMPVVMVSTLTEKGADVTLRALELGAIDFISKPKLGGTYKLMDYAQEIIAKVKMASRVHVRALSEQDVAKIKAKKHGKPVVNMFKTTHKIVAMGSSTGGTEAVKLVLSQLPADFPGIVITQHIPEAFSRSFAERVNTFSALNVCQAEDGQQILPGHAYIAPGHLHLEVVRNGARYLCHLHDEERVNHHKPSVDVLFDSVAKSAGRNALGVILTGMGNDGAKGLKRMLDAGAATIGQDEKSCVVWGMPKEAYKAGALQHVLALKDIAKKMISLVRE
ncbi:MAG: chemotaxis response regulator protein-glutamate methylesterase [Mariprofundaceae bacterium]|nr:chemotaxis response regulator protein-glutamate methylesterase [Mariprofundaceae bacterium]